MISLNRVTSSGKFYPEIDGARFLAIFSVLLTHLYYVYQKNVVLDSNFVPDVFLQFFINGGTGVHIFFVISGYILSMMFYRAACKKQQLDLNQYFVRRLTRLEPPYFVVMVTFFFLILYVKDYELSDLLLRLFASLTYTHNIFYGEGSVINTVAWSLEVELQFYILAPLLYYIYIKRKYSVFMLMFLIGVFILTNYLMGSEYRSLLSQGHFFLLGALLHLTSDKIKHLINKIDSFLAILIFCTVIFFIFSFKTIDSGMGINVIKTIFLYFMFLLIFYSPIITRLFSIKAIYLIGGMCYSIYLLHYPLLSAVSSIYSFINLSFQQDFGFTLFIILSFVVTLVISTVFYVFVEQPFMAKDPIQALKSQWVKR
jgi:peptidoglycan/LPS O-acetylase OafA/YrhL